MLDLKPREYQKAIFEIAKNNNTLVVLPTGLGKCLEFSQPVLFSNGTLMQIGEYFEKEKNNNVIKNKKDHIIIKPKKERKIISLNNDLKFEKRKIIAIHKIKVKEPLLRISTYSGAEIILTKEHPLLTLNSKLEWKRADTFKIDDYIATPSQLPEPKTKPKINLLKVFSKINNNVYCYVEITNKLAKKFGIEKELDLQRLIKLNIRREELIKNIKYFYIWGSSSNKTKIKPIWEVSNELFYWIGLIIAEASVHGGIKFYNEDKVLLKEFKKHSKRLFGITSKKIEGGLKLSSSALFYFVKNLFNLKQKQHSRDKNISNIIMLSPNNYTRSFISALFDGEGSIRENDGLIEFITASKELAHNLYYLLLRFGIKGRLKEKIASAKNSTLPKKRTYYRIFIEGAKDLESFYKKIGFKHKEKNEKLKNYLSKNKKYNPNFNLIPIEGEEIRKIREILNLSSTKRKDFDLPSIDAYERGERKLSHETLTKIIEGFEQELNKILKLENDVSWIKKQTIILDNEPNEILKKIETAISINSYLKKVKLNKKLYADWKEEIREPKLYENSPFIRLIKSIPIKTAYSGFQFIKVLEKVKKVQKILMPSYRLRMNYNFSCMPTKRKKLKKYIDTLIKNYESKLEIKDKIKFLKMLLKSQIYWDKIKKIEYVKENWVYDISLDKNFNFVAGRNGGVIAHNTLIAFLLAIHRIQEHPTKKILMLAPTRPLVEQHFETFKSNLPELFAELQIFTGALSPDKRKKNFETAEIIFSTPQTIANDLRNSLYNLQNVVLLIIDEAHRCIKNYDYTTVLEYYKRQAENQRVLGLTASPGSDAIKIKEICNHLNIEEIEIRTRDSEDVKPYIKEREFQKVEVPFPQEFIEIKVLLKRIFDAKIEQLKSRSLLFGPANKINLLQLQNKLSQRIQLRDFNAMNGMSLCAQAIKISHALELLETQTLSGLNEYLQNLITQAKEKKSKAVQSIVKTPEFNAALISIKNLLTKKVEHPKIEELAVLIENQIKENQKSKIMVFCQFRETASTIVNRLNKIPEIKASVFLGQTKKTSSSGNTTGLNQKEQKKIIEKFKSGEINAVVATAIGEEGLDIPEVSAVIFYEPIPSAIRRIQRAGRTARLSPGKLIILITKDTRDVAFHYASSSKERKMYKIIEAVKQELKDKQKNPSINNFK